MSVKLKTVNIQGKEYVMVNERLKYFRENFKGYSLTTDIVWERPSEVKEFTWVDKTTKEQKTDVQKLPGKVCMKSTVRNEQGFEVASGFAMEVEGQGMVNKTSYYENCETSAMGRALAVFGIGIDDTVASADEIAIAINRQ